MKHPEKPSDIFEFKRTDVAIDQAAFAAHLAGFQFFAVGSLLYAVSSSMSGKLTPLSLGTLADALAAMEDRSSIGKPKQTVHRDPLELSNRKNSDGGLIVAMDRFYARPLDVRMLAQSHELNEHPERHKGRRSDDFPIPDTITKIFEGMTGPVGHGYTCYQLNVSGEQVVIHSDTQRWAAAVFLTPDAPPECGTSFFRSRRAKSVRSSDHLAMLADELRGEVPLTHLEAEMLVYGNALLDRTQWQEVDRIGNVFNRLVLWDARYVHAVSDFFGHDDTTGRLVQLFFWD